MQVVSVVFVDRPELLRLRIVQRQVLSDHPHFHCPYILPQHGNVCVRPRRADDSVHGNLLPLQFRRRRLRPDCSPPPQPRRHHHPCNNPSSQSRHSRQFGLHVSSP